VGFFLSKKVKESKKKTMKDEILEFSKIKEEDIDSYITVIQKMLENNEFLFTLPGSVMIKKGVISKHNEKFKDREQEVSEIISQIFLFTYINVRGRSIYPEINEDKNIQTLINKLKNKKLYKLICSRFYSERNNFIEAKYQYLIREYHQEEIKLKLNSCEIHFTYNDLSNDAKEIVFEFDKIQLQYLVNLLKEALTNFKD